jgi:rod shape-determining protein MreC
MSDFIQKNWRVGAGLLIVTGVMFLALSGALAPFVRLALDPVVSVQRWFATRYLAVYQLVRSPADVTEMRVENERLMNENAMLRSQLIELQEQQKDNDVLYSLLEVARARPDSNYVAAMVIGRDANPFMRYIIIDQGSDAGLRHGMPVVTAQGLVGRVDAVTSNAARVQLITDPGSAVNVRLPEAKADGMLVGSVTGDINLEMVTQQAQLHPGEIILTSGLGGTYPSNLLVGQVASVRKMETALFQSAAVQPAVDFTELRAVLVVTNFKPVDLSPLVDRQSLP